MYERFTDLAAIAARGVNRDRDDAECCVAMFWRIVGFPDSCARRLFLACGGWSDAAVGSAEREEFRIESASSRRRLSFRTIEQAMELVRSRPWPSPPKSVDTADLFVALCCTVPSFADWAARRLGTDVDRLKAVSRDNLSVHAVDVDPAMPRSRLRRWLAPHPPERAREVSKDLSSLVSR